MPTPERQQDPGSQGYGGANQDDPGADKERDETPQERGDQETAEQRRLVEAQSEAEAEPVEVQAPPTDEITSSSDDDEEMEGSGSPAL